MLDSAGDVVRCHRVGRKHFLDHIVEVFSGVSQRVVDRIEGHVSGIVICLFLGNAACLFGRKRIVRILLQREGEQIFGKCTMDKMLLRVEVYMTACAVGVRYGNGLDQVAAFIRDKMSAAVINHLDRDCVRCYIISDTIDIA